jgi:hypothetical protein
MHLSTKAAGEPDYGGHVTQMFEERMYIEERHCTPNIFKMSLDVKGTMHIGFLS